MNSLNACDSPETAGKSIAPADGPEKMFVQGMSEIYSGPIVVGRDNMVFTVE